MVMLSDKKTRYIDHILTQNRSAPPNCTISHDEAGKLADSLVDGTVFGILTELRDIQHIQQSGLFKERKETVKQHKRKSKDQETAQKEAYDEMVKDPEFIPAHEDTMVKQFNNDKVSLEEEIKASLRKFDLAVLDKMDQQVKDQQQYLGIAGIPGMYITDDHCRIAKQMFILSVIESLPQQLD